MISRLITGIQTVMEIKNNSSVQPTIESLDDQNWMMRVSISNTFCTLSNSLINRQECVTFQGGRVSKLNNTLGK